MENYNDEVVLIPNVFLYKPPAGSYHFDINVLFISPGFYNITVMDIMTASAEGVFFNSIPPIFCHYY